MKRSHKIAAGIAASLGLALATAAYAHPGWYGGGPCATGAQPAGYAMGPGGGYGPGAGAGPGWMHRGGGYGPGAMMRGGGYGPGAGMGPGFGGRGLAAQLMTPEELAAHRDKMLNAATPEERQQIAAANHAELQKRAAEKGITLPQRFGPRGGFGPGFRSAPQAPAETQ